MKTKTPILTLFAALILMLLLLCNKNNGTSEKLSSPSKTTTNDKIQHDSDNSIDSPQLALDNTPKTNATDYAKIGFDLEENDFLGFLKIGMFADTVIKELGEPEEKSKVVEWDADGLNHQTWNYKSKGIELSMVQDSVGQEIEMITITSPCKFCTKRGIKIGSTRDSVEVAYREAIDPKDTVGIAAHVIAGTVYGGIIFDFENEKVSSIYIGAIAE